MIEPRAEIPEGACDEILKECHKKKETRLDADICYQGHGI